jgi:predicted nucleic acid-binding protein
MIQRLLVDTGVWYAMFSRRDTHRPQAPAMAAHMATAKTLVLPWPALYETLRTRFVKETASLLEFKDYMNSTKAELLDSSRYDKTVLKTTYDWALVKDRPMSMVDCLIRHVIEDRDSKIDGLATFNHRDFYDICAKREIILLS